jgi:uncharacterized membrane protein YfcA
MRNYIIDILLLAAGVFGGFLNALASSGSSITLPFMVYLGIPPSIANATNRIPCLVGFTTSTLNFHKAKLIDWSKVFVLSIPLVCGNVLGVLLVLQLHERYIKYILIGALFLSLVLAFTKFKQIVTQEIKNKQPITPITFLLFFLIGIWAGVIVLDTATFILFSLTLHLGIDLIKSNAIKSAVSLILLIVSSLIFIYKGQINWNAAIFLSIGSFFGGYFGSKLAISENSRALIYKALISILVIELITLSFHEFI